MYYIESSTFVKSAHNVMPKVFTTLILVLCRKWISLFKTVRDRIFQQDVSLHLDFLFFSSQVHDYYKQALQFLDTQGPSFMGSRKAKVLTCML